MIIKVGRNAYNPKFFRSIHIVEEPYDVSIKIIAITDRGQKITLKSVNMIDRPEQEAHKIINEWFDYYISAMEGGDTK